MCFLLSAPIETVLFLSMTQGKKCTLTRRSSVSYGLQRAIVHFLNAAIIVLVDASPLMHDVDDGPVRKQDLTVDEIRQIPLKSDRTDWSLAVREDVNVALGNYPRVDDVVVDGLVIAE